VAAACRTRARAGRQRVLDVALHVFAHDTPLATAALDLVDVHAELAGKGAHGGAGIRRLTRGAQLTRLHRWRVGAAVRTGNLVFGGFRIAALLAVVLVLLVLAVLAVVSRALVVLDIFRRRRFCTVGSLSVVTGGLLRCVGRFFVVAIARIAFLDHG